jgi:hypothetical protein
MAAEKPRSIEIRDFLVPGPHDALLAVMQVHSRRAGNQLVLSISEACIGGWPLGLSDYEPAPEVLKDRQRVKVTIREDRHPNLFKLYRSIGLGSKGQVFLNLFNRHMSVREENPDAVNEAVMKMHEMLMAKKTGDGSEVIEKMTAPTMSAQNSEMGPVGHDMNVQATDVGSPSETIAVVPPATQKNDVVFVTDPLSAVPIAF